MKSAYKVENNMYSSVKRVAEELRALSFEFKCPIVSVSQVNREGFFVNFNELDFSYTAESMGIPATADFMCLLGTDEEQMVYESEILYRITKSRIGLPNQQNKFFLDKRSLKMYDSSEEDVWIEDATISGDNRRQVVIDEERNNRRNRRRRD
jgi:3-deoxy-D-arabino-heptulosonate 7-phosphate (DAHP) synthase class II